MEGGPINLEKPKKRTMNAASSYAFLEKKLEDACSVSQCREEAWQLGSGYDEQSGDERKFRKLRH
ncbi:hypothetical protein FTE24_005675 [Saccharibacillus sp. WB 17]|nr:hypothetical protein [Saccharibacillus sp. WB 17]